MYQLIIFGLAALLTATVIFVYKKKTDENFLLFMKVLTVSFCAIGFFRFMLSDAFIDTVINGGRFNGVFVENTDALASVLRWGTYISYVVYPMAVFFDSRLFKNIACYVCMPFWMLSAVFIENYMKYFLSSAGRGLHPPVPFRYFYFCLEVILAILIPALMMTKGKHAFRIKDKREWLNFGICLPLVLLQVFPAYLPQAIFGFTDIRVDTFTGFHIGWLVLTVVETIALYYIFRFKDYKTRYMLVVFLMLALLYHYNAMFLKGFYIRRLPVQLCNLAAYLYVIAIVFKNRPLFNFCYIVNTVGTVIAMVTPDFSAIGLEFWNMHYMLEHGLVFMIPVLCMALRIFPRIDKSAFKHAVVGYNIYFVFCFISGTIINGFSAELGDEVNFFFMFSIEKATEFVPFLKFAEDLPVVIGRFSFYPILVALIYFGFSVLYLAWYFLIPKVYAINEDHQAMRRARIDLYEKITGKKSRAIREYED